MSEHRPRLVESSRRLSEPVMTARVEADMDTVDKKVRNGADTRMMARQHIPMGNFTFLQVEIDSDSLGEQSLPCFYAEDTSNAMNLERRREALGRFMAVLGSDIDRERKGKVRVEQRISLSSHASVTWCFLSSGRR